MYTSDNTTYIYIPVPIPSAVVGSCFLTLVLASVIVYLIFQLHYVQGRCIALSADQQVANNFDNDTQSHNTSETLNDSNLRNLSMFSANNPVTKLDLPAFYEGNAKLRVKVVKSSFRCQGIVESKEKYDLVLCALKVKQLQQVENIIPAADSDLLDDPYQNIREALIKENTLTESERIETLLHGVHLENDKPTEMLRKLKRLMSDDRPSIPLLTKLFMDKLPCEVQRLLAATGETELDV